MLSFWLLIILEKEKNAIAINTLCEWVTNCKGPHTINAASVGSTRDLIGQKDVWRQQTERLIIREKRFETQVSSRYVTWYSERVILQFMCVGPWAGVTFRYTMLTSPKGETAVHCCHPCRLLSLHCTLCEPTSLRDNEEISKKSWLNAKPSFLTLRRLHVLGQIKHSTRLTTRDYATRAWCSW